MGVEAVGSLAFDPEWNDLGCESLFNLSEQICFTLQERPDAGPLFSVAFNNGM